MAIAKKVAIVTGAGTGIGKCTALAFLRDGYSVALAGRRAALLKDAALEGGALGTRALVVPTDVTDPDSVASLFGLTVEAFGRVDVLFNNAGIGAPSVPIYALTHDQWKSVLEVNLTGTFLCLREAFKIMKKQKPMGGRIINNGSVSAQVPRPDSAPYTASKHGVTGLTRSAALDGRKYDIACGQIDIGNAETSMTRKMVEGIRQADGSILNEPTIDSQHVAETVLHMASLPLDANVQFVTIMATKMPFIGRG